MPAPAIVLALAERFHTPGAGNLMLAGEVARGGSSNDGGGGAGLGGAIFNQGTSILEGVILRNNGAYGGVANASSPSVIGGDGMGADAVDTGGGGSRSS